MKGEKPKTSFSFSFFQPKKYWFSQNPLIKNYNRFVEELAKIGIVFDKLAEKGLCSGLTLNYLLYSYEERREEFLSYLKFIAALKKPEHIKKLVQEYQKIREKKTFWVKADKKAEPVLFHKLIKFFESLNAAQDNKFFSTVIHANWDRTYSFICERNALANKLKEAEIANGGLFYMHVGAVHSFAIECTDKGFYVFEPNKIKSSYEPLLSEIEVANEIIDNLISWGALSKDGPELILLGVSSLSFGNKNRELDDALMETKVDLSDFKEFIEQYQQGKRSRLDLALILHDKIKALERKSFAHLELDRELVVYIEKHAYKPQVISEKEAVSPAYLKYCESYWLPSAVHYGQINCVKMLLEKGANPNDTDSEGRSALQLAVMSDYLDLADLLIKNHADPNLKDKNGVTTLMVAIDRKNFEMLRLLLAKAADPDIKTNEGGTALLLACKEKQFEAIRLLLEYGAAPVGPNSLGDDQPIIIWASTVEDSEVVKFLLKVIPHIKIADLNMALFQSCIRGKDNVEIVRSLLQRGANPNYSINYSTVLASATERGNIGVVKTLLEYKADPDYLCQYGFTPLTRASQDGHVHIMRELLNAKADIESGTYLLTSSLYETAKENGLKEKMEDLLKAYREKFFICTPLIASAINGKIDAVKLLVESGADYQQKVCGIDLDIMTEALGYSEIASFLKELNAKNTPSSLR